MKNTDNHTVPNRERSTPDRQREYARRYYIRRRDRFRTLGLTCAGRTPFTRKDGGVYGSPRKRIVSPNHYTQKNFYKQYGCSMAAMAQQEGVSKQMIWIRFHNGQTVCKKSTT